MSGFKHILFPVDFSDECAAMRPLVFSVAQKFRAKLTLLNAFKISPSMYDPTGGLYGYLDIPGIRKSLAERLGHFFASPQLPVTIESVVEEGDPGGCIVSWAADHDADLIMMPTHGYGPFRRFLLGSIAGKVLHDSHCPVWTSAHLESPKSTARLEIENIVCATDLTSEGAGLVRDASALAKAFSAKLWLVHAFGVTPTNASLYTEMDFNHFLRQAARDGMARLQREAGTELPVEVAEGAVPKVVSEFAAAHNADLVVIGRGRQRQPLGGLRSNAYAIIRDSPCSVLSF